MDKENCYCCVGKAEPLVIDWGLIGASVGIGVPSAMLITFVFIKILAFLDKVNKSR